MLVLREMPIAATHIAFMCLRFGRCRPRMPPAARPGSMPDRQAEHNTYARLYHVPAGDVREISTTALGLALTHRCCCLLD